MAGSYSILNSVYITISLSVDEHFGYFHVLATVKDALRSMGGAITLLVLGMNPEEGLLGWSYGSTD
jgi:hypothetical protein